MKDKRFQVQIVDFGSILEVGRVFEIDAGLCVDFMYQMLILAC